MHNGDQPPAINNAAQQPHIQNPPPVLNHAPQQPLIQNPAPVPPPPTHVLVSKVRYCFLRQLEERPVPEDTGARLALLHGELKTSKTELKSDIASHKGKPFLLALCLLAFITLLVISELYGDNKNKNHNKDDETTDYGIGVASLVGTFLMAILTYIVKRQQARDEQHLEEVKDSRETLKGIDGP